MAWKKDLAGAKIELNKVSPSFCLAKWLQVTIHLQNGCNHSCHHPTLHKIPLDELKINPSALHNTLYKKQMREMMLRGKRPEECFFCWDAEDVSGDHFSDRILKSTDYWAKPSLEKIAKSSSLLDVNPTYMEVSFGSECGFKCAYCLPNVSSSIWQEYEKFGPYVGRPSLEQLTSEGLKPIPANEKNPYVEAFWQWFPSAVKDLLVLRITGGEPLINENTFKVLDYLDAHPQPRLELCINSNLGVSEKKLNLLIEKLNALSATKKIGKFILYTSIDTHGSQAEYIRFGLNYERWKKNVLRYLDQTEWPITFMVTLNALSIPRLHLLLEDLMEIKKSYNSGDQSKVAIVDISHLTSPEYLALPVLDKFWRKKIDQPLNQMENLLVPTPQKPGFQNFEIHKLKRAKLWMESHPLESDEILSHRANFFLFTKQYEQRKGLSFLSNFPEMEEFIVSCKKAWVESES